MSSEPETKLYSVYIINKSGGLIYHKDYVERVNKLTSNHHLQIAGVFHSMYAITSQLTPTKETSSGIRCLEADSMKIKCFQTVTGTKFIVLAPPTQINSQLDDFLQQMYQLYADFVLKNPFYDLEQPIHNCDKFQIHLDALIAASFNRST